MSHYDDKPGTAYSALMLTIVGGCLLTWACGGRTAIELELGVLQASSGGTGNNGTRINFASGGATVATSTDATTGGTRAIIASPAIDTLESCLSVNDNYVVGSSQELTGYAYTFTIQADSTSSKPTTIAPICDQLGCAPPFPSNALCASGVVPAAPHQSATAGIGFNVKQPQTSYNLDSAIGSQLNWDNPQFTFLVNVIGGFQIQTRLIAADGTVYCSETRVSEKTTGASMDPRFPCSGNPNTTPNALTPITAVQIVVPSNSSKDTVFDFCLLCISPIIII